MRAGAKFSREMLNAYVDGETDAWTSAEIAEAVAGDPRLAAEVAALAQAKSAAAGAFAQWAGPAPDIAALRPAGGRTADRRLAWWAGGLIAASLALAAVLGPAVWPFAVSPDPVRAWAGHAVAEFEIWADAQQGETGLSGAAGSTVLVAGLPHAIPDLSIARLSVAHLEVMQAADGPAMFVGYLGRNGCRLGFWVTPAPEGLEESLVLGGGREGMRLARWRVGDTGYAVLARGMDDRRFDAVTAVLQAESRRGGASDTRVAGRVYRAPCVG
ncbi:hypothetical protein [Futiania mangrovi]|uniref:Anti-sigma factor n=1 Tax=Futiania mangrovi TaxID=2959716 RepID=A0A9J6PDM4_9PROT|nr:hypothetical protein [Futiania mangrovii]MCP1336745.1 hypothetical protein [Futiania mangrovii]